jgi:hypothetical protein
VLERLLAEISFIFSNPAGETKRADAALAALKVVSPAGSADLVRYVV